MLGRGLESLIPNKSAKKDEFISAKTAAGDSIFQIEVDKISFNPFQPRKIIDPENLKELAASIREMGIIQPILVSKREVETSLGTEVNYELIAGQRRLMAAKLLGLPRIPAIIRKVPVEKEKLELAMVENIQRENLNSIETARAYSRLQEEFGLTQREIAGRVGRTRETISNTVRLLNLPTHIQEALMQNQISESQGRVLLAVADQREQQRLFEDIQRNNVSVRDLKERVRGLGKKTTEIADPDLTELKTALKKLFGNGVKIEYDKTTGKIKLIFNSSTELEKIMRQLSGPTSS